MYEVYTHVSEMHLKEIGLKTEWHEVDMLDEGEVTWEGVVRRVRDDAQYDIKLADGRRCTVLEYPLRLSTTHLHARLLEMSPFRPNLRCCRQCSSTAYL